MKTLGGCQNFFLGPAVKLHSESAVQAVAEQVFPRVPASLTSDEEKTLIEFKINTGNVRIYQRLIS